MDKMPNKQRFEKLSDEIEDKKDVRCICNPLNVSMTLLFCGTFVMILYFIVFGVNISIIKERSSFNNYLQKRKVINEAYITIQDLDWPKILKYLEASNRNRERKLNFGILNFYHEEVQKFKELLPDVNLFTFELDHLSANVTWNSLYPGWINEEHDISRCPNLPLPKIANTHLDMVAVKLPHSKQQYGSSRDVARLHLQLAAANLAMSAKEVCYVLLVTQQWPMIDIFKLKELVVHSNNLWIFRIDKRPMKQKLELPVGSCELATVEKIGDRQNLRDIKHGAYATVLHSHKSYVCGAIVLAHSIRLTGSIMDLVALVDKHISQEERKALQAIGWKIQDIKRIRNPKAVPHKYNEWNYSKFRLWQLTDYEKIIFLDADMLVLRNLDFLFEMPEITASGNDGFRFNSGLMVLEPSNYTFDFFMNHINDINSYNGGDQGFLNEVFLWWHRLPKHINFKKFTWSTDPNESRHKNFLYASEPPILYAVHYLGIKPWMCYRDYDCNWNDNETQKFANDFAHARWWKLHDTLPQKLQKFCYLSEDQKNSLELKRREAKLKKLSDRHWKRVITDTRLNLCYAGHCSKEISSSLVANHTVP